MKNSIVLLLLPAILSAGCGSPAGKEAATEKELVVVKGSDTMLPLATPWAEEYMGANPSAEVSVSGGGSGTGFAALINGNTDICAASRDISADEKAKMEAKGLNVQEITVARDGIAIIVNPANPVNELSLQQLERIYTSSGINWQEFGGADASIVAYARESSSGTYVFFQEHVLQKKDYDVNVRLMPATAAIIQAVQADTNAIGYVGLGHAHEAANQVKVVAVRMADGQPGVAASEQAVLDGTYPISRALYFYTNTPAPTAVQSFIEYCLGKEGQNTAKEIGFVPVK